MASQADEGKSAAAFLGEQASMIVDKGFSFSGFERDTAFLNRGDGTFLDVSGCSGLDSISDGRAAVFADFDNDGDADVFLRAMHSQAHLLFRNEIGAASGGFVRIALRGTAGDAFGAVVRVTVAGRTTAQAKLGGSGFMAQHDPRLLFGLGDAAQADAVEIAWPSGARQSLGPLAAGSSVLVVEGEREPRRVEEKRFSLPAPWTRGDAAWQGVMLARGDGLPALAVQDLDGTERSLVLAPGRRTLVNLWAPWCQPCRREMPELQRMSLRGTRVIGVCADPDATRAAIHEALEATGAAYPQWVATPQALEAIFRDGRVALPTTLVLDERGRVIDVVSGGSRADVSRLLAAAGR